MKTQNNTTITVFGDSISKGLFLNGTKIDKLSTSAVDILQNNFMLEIENKSAFGQTLKRVYEKGMIDQYLEKINYDNNNMVVFALGGNDSDYNWDEVQKEPDAFHTSKTGLAEFSCILEESINKLKMNNVKVVIASVFPIDSKRYFENVLSVKYDGQKILQFLHNDLTNIARHQEIFNVACLKSAIKNNCSFLDYRSVFLNLANMLDYMCDDGIHPNEKGQTVIAEFIMQKILSRHNNLYLPIGKKNFAIEGNL